MIEEPEHIEQEEIQMAFADEEFKEREQRPSFLENNDTVIEHAPMDQTVEQVSAIMPFI